MSAGKPRGPTPSLIGSSNGRPKRVAVGKLSECCRCHCEMVKGQTCIEIPKLGGAYTNPKRYCDKCYKKILEKTNEDLVDVTKL
jgi:hypothetical protein